MSSTVPTAIDAPDPRNLRRSAQGAWTLYDFANTIFSFAIVSGAMGQWLIDEHGDSSGSSCSASPILASVGLNAIVSPILGALADRGGRRLPFLLVFTALCVAPTAFIGISGPAVGALLFVVANFSYQAALIYYDSSIKLVSTPATRGRLSGVGTGIGYCGTVFVALLIQFGQIPVEARFPLAAVLFALFAIPVFLVLREPPRHGPAAHPARPRRLVAQLPRTWRHAGRGPRPPALPRRAASSTRMRSTP